MSQNLLSAAVVIGVLRVKLVSKQTKKTMKMKISALMSHAKFASFYVICIFRIKFVQKDLSETLSYC